MSNPKTKRCGKPTKAGTPCKWPSPCPTHERERWAKAKGKKELAAIRMEKLIKLRLQGKPVSKAAKSAGYPDSVCKGKIYQIIDTPEYKEAIERHIKLSRIDTNEIIGRSVGSMRMDLADLFPDDEVLQRAKRLGISQNIKKVKRRLIIVGFDPEDSRPIYGQDLEVECYSAQEDRKMLADVFGLKQLPAPNQKAQRDFEAAVDRLMQAAKTAGNKLPDAKLRKQIEKKLRPRFEILVRSDAVN